jgi:hypothetical protein
MCRNSYRYDCCRDRGSEERRRGSQGHSSRLLAKTPKPDGKISRNGKPKKEGREESSCSWVLYKT